MQRDLPLGLPESISISVLLDEKKQFPLFDHLAVLEEDPFEVPCHPGGQAYSIDSLGIPG
jgi:hypothetical protein